MQYILTTGWEDGIADLTQRLVHELSNDKKVLWLTSGGSNIPAIVQIMSHVTADLSEGLTVLPVDERYGEVGHENSNWAALMRAGFKGQHAELEPVLFGDLSFQATIVRFQHIATKAFAANDCIIGQFGIGDDGHIAGILPESEAAHEKIEFVSGYHTEQYDRLTLTFSAIKQITAAYVFAFGEAKANALKILETKIVPLEKQPAQILKQMREAYVYNDQRGDT
jgi:6-phosphogluconolactonase/glucosamine-6-phosphate isomerase/deaminase